METLAELIGRSPAIEALRGQVERLLLLPAGHRPPPVLLLGETGAGKGLVARLLHHRGPRARGPFIDVNCAAIPDTLLESELFGYKRGAFTDARTDRPGMFVEADDGTIFLDEIGDLSPQLQAKLLRVLQERELRPLGAARPEKVDVRVLSATNRDLAQRMREGAFREDLFYRLNVIEVMLSPLRDRVEDVLPLSDHFLTEAAARTGKRIATFTQSALKVLLAYPWPGNVRELENVIERAVALAEGDQIGPDDLPSQVRERRSADVLAGALARGLTLAELEREYINRVLTAEGGNKTRAAQRLGLDRKTLYRKLEEYGRAPGEPGSPQDLADERATSDRVEREPEPQRNESTLPIPRIDPDKEFED